MKNLEFKNFEIKSIKENENALELEGYGACFNNIDSYKDVIKKGAFTKTLKENNDRVAFCYQHDIYNPIGKIIDIKEDDKGLFIKVRLSESEKNIQQKVKEGILKEMSIGYQTIKQEQGMQEGVEVMFLTEIKLYEISLVTIAANPKAIITGLKSEEKQDFISKEFDRLIAIERNNTKQFELLKLKALVCDEPTMFTPEPTPPLNNLETIIKNQFKDLESWMKSN